MVNIIENWVQVKGRVMSAGSHPQLEEYDKIEIRIMEKKQHQRFPDLVPLAVASKIGVNLKKSTKKSLQIKEGVIVQGLVRATARNEYFFKEDSVRIVKSKEDT